MHTIYASFVTLLVFSLTIVPLCAEFKQHDLTAINDVLRYYPYDPKVVTIYGIQGVIERCPACMHQDITQWTKSDLIACQKALFEDIEYATTAHSMYAWIIVKKMAQEQRNS